MALGGKMLLESPQGPSGDSQGAPEPPPGPPKVAQGSSQDRPQAPQSIQKHPQKSKFEPKSCSRSLWKPISVGKNIRDRFSHDFGWIFTKFATEIEFST